MSVKALKKSSNLKPAATTTENDNRSKNRRPYSLLNMTIGELSCKKLGRNIWKLFNRLRPSVVDMM